MTTTTQVDSAYSHAITKSDNIKMITENLRELLNKMALDHPNHVAYIFEENGGLEITYAELKRRVEQTARNLQSLGFVKGDILAFMFPYTIETLIITFACSYIGVISAPLDPWWCVKELEHALEIINPKGLILLSSFENVFYLREFKKFCPAFETSTKGNLRCSTFTNLKHVILARKLENYQLEVEDDSSYSNAWDIDEILLENSSLTKDIKKEWPELNPHDPWFIVFTSGTTGRKKGSHSTFYKFINDCQIHLSYALSNSSNQDVFDNFCYTMSLNFIASQLFGFLPALTRKTRTIIPGLKRGNKEATLKALEKYKCTSLMASPKHLFDILNGSNFDLPSLRYILAGSQTVTIDLIEQSFERFKLDKLFIYYGMTEILISSVMVIDDPKEARMNRKDDCVSVGRPLPFYEFKVVDLSTKSVLPFDTPGELYVNSFTNFNGYWRNEEKTKEIIGSDQWLRTGDLVKMDSDGYIYHKNRVTESIEFGDMTIFPSEVESVLRTHENVADASVFSIKAEHGLDLCGCAWVILKDKTKTTSVDELRSVCGVERGMIEHIKFVNDFPTSENGKIVKTKMASLYKQELNIKT